MNATTAELFRRLGVRVPNIMLPREDVDLYRWGVIACDQHTSEPDYWQDVAGIVGDQPSTLHLIYPEVYLGERNADARIQRIHETMRRYVDEGVLSELDPAMVLTKRTIYGSERHGLMLALDLEAYEYTPGARSLTRATEQTILERIPPRVRIREGAPLEVPHVIVLVDDPDDTLFAGLRTRDLTRLYSTELMLGGGEVQGFRVDADALDHVAHAFEKLLQRSDAPDPFLFAVGDGNHSLATAKEVWERLKTRARTDATSELPEDHPARYALVEVVNLYDPGLRFEPIHRLVRTEAPAAWVGELARAVGNGRRECPLADLEAEMKDITPSIGYVTAESCGVIPLAGSGELPVSDVQGWLDRQDGLEVDYIHGWETSLQLGRKPASVAIVLPDFDPGLLYPTVSKQGVLPRKAFSLGEAEEKRYYLEARGIS